MNKSVDSVKTVMSILSSQGFKAHETQQGRQITAIKDGQVTIIQFGRRARIHWIDGAHANQIMQECMSAGIETPHRLGIITADERRDARALQGRKKRGLETLPASYYPYLSLDDYNRLLAS